MNGPETLGREAEFRQAVRQGGAPATPFAGHALGRENGRARVAKLGHRTARGSPLPALNERYHPHSSCSRALTEARKERDTSLVQTETVTRKNVAGIDTPPPAFWFCDFASSHNCRCNSSTLSFFSAASNAFIVGP